MFKSSNIKSFIVGVLFASVLFFILYGSDLKAKETLEMCAVQYIEQTKQLEDIRSINNYYVNLDSVNLAMVKAGRNYMPTILASDDTLALYYQGLIYGREYLIEQITKAYKEHEVDGDKGITYFEGKQSE